MSNTRKLRQPGGDREREQRHMAWLNREDNAERLTEGTLRAYTAEGRGFWFASSRYGTTPDYTRMQYVPQADIGLFPGGRNREVVTRMVATYDPARQVVVVIEEDGQLSAYKVRPAQLNPSLN
jgi:hypothetical protein